MKRLYIPSLLCIFFAVSYTYAGNQKNFKQINFDDGTSQTTAATGSGGGVSVYNATATAGFPYGLSASTVSVSTINVTGQVIIPTGSSGVPNLVRAGGTTTGIGILNGSVDIDVAGTSILNVAANSMTSNAAIIVNNQVITTTNSPSLSLTGSASAGLYYTRLQFSGGTDVSSIGMRDKPGEDPYFFIAPRDIDTGFFLTDVFHVNTSSYSGRSGFVGVKVSTPLTELQVEGRIGLSNGVNIATISYSNNYNGLLVSTDTTFIGVISASAPVVGISTISYGLTVGGHIEVSSGTPTLSSCGSSPSIVGNDMAGKITAGTGATSCTMTFVATWVNAPSCSILADTAVAAPTGTSTTTAFTFGGTTISGYVIMYQCQGWR